MSFFSSEKSFEDCLIREGNFHLLSGCNGNIDLFENGLELSRVIIDLIVDNFDFYNKLFLLGDYNANILRIQKLKEITNSLINLDYDIYDYQKLINDSTIVNSSTLNIDYTSLGYVNPIEYTVVLSDNG